MTQEILTTNQNFIEMVNITIPAIVSDFEDHTNTWDWTIAQFLESPYWLIESRVPATPEIVCSRWAIYNATDYWPHITDSFWTDFGLNPADPIFTDPDLPNDMLIMNYTDIELSKILDSAVKAAILAARSAFVLAGVGTYESNPFRFKVFRRQLTNKDVGIDTAQDIEDQLAAFPNVSLFTQIV